MGRRTARARVVRIEGGRPRRREDAVAVEEPLEIRIDGTALAVTMRTPGHDIDLALGFLLTEGIIRSAGEVSTAELCAGPDGGPNTYNVVDVSLTRSAAGRSRVVARQFYVTSSCGVCGKASIDAVRTRTAHPIGSGEMAVAAGTLAAMPDALRGQQRVFAETGGLHAAALFDADGGLTAVREDVGRHNAVDKVIGDALRREALPLHSSVLMVSGRASFELVQKALMAGIPMLAAVSAPSSLAVELAEEAGMTLVGFLRGDTMNVYAGATRVRLATPTPV
jgi:FdhD protein